MLGFIRKLIGTKTQRDMRLLLPLVDRINVLEAGYQSLSDDALRAKTAEFKARVAGGESLDSLLCEAFAVVKSACRRLVGTRVMVCGNELAWDMVPFDVQLMGGIVLHQGKIAEMQTGEGKTLVATLPLYLNALSGRNVQLVTVNDYLARRDSQWMGHVYTFLGLTVGCIQNNMPPMERREHYGRDITYGTNSEFGFDYLRDNGMAYEMESMVQRDYYYAIVDEVDSILVDEARTPLIISGPAPSSSHKYFELKPRVEQLVRKQQALCDELVQKAKTALEKGDNEAAQYLLYQVRQGMPKHRELMPLLEDPKNRRLLERVEGLITTDMYKAQGRQLREELLFVIDERGHDVSLTDKGCETISPNDPEAYVVPDLVTAVAELEADATLSELERTERRQKIQGVFMDRSERIHNVDQLIRAYCLYEKDVGYVVQNNQVLIVDEYTGRILPGRRWSDGLHQAVEAKEGVKIEHETQTLATITIQNYFRMYQKLAGMTGTAETEAQEFQDIYKLDVVCIPTNRPVRRVDRNDQIYKTQREKFKAIIDEIAECHRRGQPVLVGTVSVETSEMFSRMLRQANIIHSVLNAKNHEREAEIVKNAGQFGAVTIATNMAGRGTDIKLGEGVVHIDRSVVMSNTSLDDRLEPGGKTLRALLMEKPCGLYVIGSERHESRRIDRQLRGRCARQGDPGSSRFYVSLEDDLMRLFGSDRIAGIMSRLGLQEGEVMEHPWLNRSIETAQRRVEQQNFSIRKRTLEYDDVMNKQRAIVYGFRRDIAKCTDARPVLFDVFNDVIISHAEDLLHGKDEGVHAFVDWARTQFPIAIRADEIAGKADDVGAATDFVFERVAAAYMAKVSLDDPMFVKIMERQMMIHTIDRHWQEYLRSMDALRQGVGLRAYGQQDPLVEYKREAFEMFGNLMTMIKQEMIVALFRVRAVPAGLESMMAPPRTTLVHQEVSLLGGGAATVEEAVSSSAPQPPATDPRFAQPFKRMDDKVGRNDPCPCGSGKKYKKCCGQGA